MKVNTKKNNAINNQEVEKLIVVNRAKQFDDGKIVFDMIVNDVSIYGCRLIEGKKGNFVAFPQRKGKDGEYYRHAYVKLSDEDVANIVAQIEKM